MAAQPRSQSALTDRLPLVSGAVAGVVTFLIGYALTFLLKAGEVSELLTRSLGDTGGSALSLPGDWQVVGWFFFQMHNVGTRTQIAAGGQSQTGTTTGSVETWMLLIPIVLLFLAGFVVVRRADVHETLAGAQAGAAVLVGYAVLAAVFAFLTTWRTGASGFGTDVTVSVGPPLVTGILTAGILYPLVLGALGGAFAASTAG